MKASAPSHCSQYRHVLYFWLFSDLCWYSLSLPSSSGNDSWDCARLVYLCTFPIPLLACPVLFCTTHSHSLSLSLTVSLFSLPSSLLLHSSDLFLPLWSRSLSGRGERRKGRQEYQRLLCTHTLGLSSLVPLDLPASPVSIVVANGKRWQSWSVGSNSEVGTFDSYVIFGLGAVGCAKGVMDIWKFLSSLLEWGARICFFYFNFISKFISRVYQNPGVLFTLKTPLF